MVQAHREAGDHLAAELGVAFQFVEDDGFGDVQQQRVGERLREDHVGLVHEHHGFAEGLALADDVDDLFGTLGRGESQF